MMKEQLQAKLAEYQAAMLQATANANALQGAIQDVQYWLSQLEAEASKAQTAPAN